MSDDTEATQGLSEDEAVVETSAIEDAPETGTEQAPEEEVDDEPKPKHKPWFQERIDQLTREKYEARREADAYQKLVETMRSGDPEARSNADVDTLANAKAVELFKAQQFNDKCNSVYSSGKSEFADFDTTIQNFGMLGGLSPAVLEAVTQLPDAHKVLHALGNDMDEAARIFSLAPVPMAMALAKLSVSPAKSKPVSNAPRPITPIDGSPKGEPSPDKMNYSEWEDWRNKQIAKRG